MCNYTYWSAVYIICMQQWRTLRAVTEDFVEYATEERARVSICLHRLPVGRTTAGNYKLHSASEAAQK